MVEGRWRRSWLVWWILCLALPIAADAAPLRVGQRVLARWKIGENHLYWYPATIASIFGGYVVLAYDDGSNGPADLQ
ncbi:MAG: hypothetical protein KC609_11705, partial [Myxococcales bacterium]|nr:hypothetical protein [Myxococcales bacterium]